MTLDQPQWTRLEELFSRALQMAPEERQGFAVREVGDDSELLDELLSLLGASEDAGLFIDRLKVDLLGVDAEEILRGSPSTAATADPWVGQRVGRYRVERMIGGGGMGVVYRARDATLGRTVALKFIAPEISRDDDAKRRFVREARTASALDHPNICTIYEIAEAEGGRLYIAMAAYDGESLRDRIRRGPLDERECLGVLKQVAQALGAAHDKGIVHRDVKPGNVFLAESGLVKLLDFGLARTAGAPVTDPGAMKGTIDYMSPEQARGEPADARSDVWAAGVLLYEMLSGTRPFAAPTPLVTVRYILDREPDWEALTQVASPSTMSLLRTTLQKDADSRLADGTALLKALG